MAIEIGEIFQWKIVIPVAMLTLTGRYEASFDRWNQLSPGMSIFQTLQVMKHGTLRKSNMENHHLGGGFSPYSTEKD